jgi:uncharacterized membrane protein
MPAASTTARRGVAALAAAGCGLGVSGYLTVLHYTGSRPAACPASATIDYAKVTTSAWSHVGPVPVALLGALFFAAMSLLCTPAARRRQALDPARVVGAGSGVLAALYLVWVELFRVGAICLWCTAAHLCALALLAAVLWTTTSTRPEQLTSTRR